MSGRLFPRRGAPALISAKGRAAQLPRFAPFMRSYAAASGSSLLADWTGTSTSANGISAREAQALRRRARELRENSSIVARYSALCRDNIIGPHGPTLAAFVPSTRGKNVEASAGIERRWYQWATSVTADGRTLTDALALFVESWKIEGEGLWIVETRGNTLVVTPVDADRLDQAYSETLRNGNVVEQSVETDATGRVVAYWLWDADADDITRRRRRRWPAESILYKGHCTRPNQRRGITPLAPVMVLIQHLEKTDEALVVLNRTTASKMFQYVAQGEWAPPLTNPDGSPLDPSMQQDEVAPGGQWVPPWGYRAEAIDPGNPTQEYGVLSNSLQRRIAAGLNVAHTSLSGDLSEANYGSQRGGLIGERDAWMVDQEALIDTVLRPLFAMWLRLEIMTRRVVLPSGVVLADVLEQTEWHPRRWAWIDPLKDAEGIRALLEMRLTSRTRELNKMGVDVRTLFQEIADEEQMAKDVGIQLPTASAPTTTTPSPAPERGLRAVA